MNCGINVNPSTVAYTMISIVPTVNRQKVAVTAIKLKMFAVAAGYIRIGIKGSHGPNANMIKRIHLVSPDFDVFSLAFSGEGAVLLMA